MKHWFPGLMLTLVLTLSAGIGSAAAEPQPLQHIFIISVDGLNYEGYVSAPVHNMKDLAGEGVWDEKSMALQVDTVEAAEASLLTGSFPQDHQHITVKDKIQTETLCDIVSQMGKKYAVIDGSGGKLQAYEKGDKTYYQVTGSESDERVLEQALKVFKQDRPFLSYIYLNDCRHALLSLDEKAYYETVKECDQALGRFINSLRQEDAYYNSLIVVTSARSSSPSNNVPLIIHGPGLKSNTRINNSMVIDVAPTVCKLIQADHPANSRGIMAVDALLLSPEEEQQTMRKWTDSLKSDRVSAWSKYFALQDELYQTIYQMTSIKEEKQNIFNFVGEKEDAINSLQNRIRTERLIYLGIFICMLAAYVVEYLILKKKFLLFK
jgi:predicted AlkP superfamily pyrophosphatase or phosphodiesterase